jgi:hypothetical protein
MNHVKSGMKRCHGILTYMIHEMLIQQLENVCMPDIRKCDIHKPSHLSFLDRLKQMKQAKFKPVRMFPVMEVLRLLRVATTAVKSYVITVKLYTKNQNYNIQN